MIAYDPTYVALQAGLCCISNVSHMTFQRTNANGFPGGCELCPRLYRLIVEKVQKLLGTMMSCLYISAEQHAAQKIRGVDI